VGRTREQFIDEGIFGLADGQVIKPRHLEETKRIIAAGMG
jgi:hypothetical protein